MKKPTAYLIAVFIFPTLIMSVNETVAIPAFARKYRISCNACHVAVPKLKEYGENFAGNGFVLPDGEEPARANIDTGDESLLLMRELPIAVRFDAFIKAEDNDQAKIDLGVPYGIKLLSGGLISKKISYYLYFYMMNEAK